MYQAVKIKIMAIKRHIFLTCHTDIYAKLWTFEILLYKTEHIIWTPSWNIYQTVNIWNMAIEKLIFSSQHRDICETMNIWNIGI